MVVHGPRQAGKSTLVRDLLDDRDALYVTFDDLAPRSAATRDPEGFVAALDRPAVLDETQRVPDLILAIKAAVDRDRRPGRFLLTGSADIFSRDAVDDTLAGRRETLTLWPLTQAEIERGVPRSPTDWFASDPLSWATPPVTVSDLLPRLLRGGYPEAVGRTPDRRERWFANYLDEVVRFEVADGRNLEQLAEIPTMLRLIAARDAGLLNAASLATDLAFSPRTLRRYLALLTQVFLVQLLPAWTTSQRKRLVKSPKVLIADTGLSAHLQGTDEPTPERIGTLLETFVITEVRRLLDTTGSRLRMFHFRTHAGHEVDLVLERPDGGILGVEIKARGAIRSHDLRGLRSLAEAAGDRFVRGLVLHPGREVVPLGERFWSVPMSVLWS